MRNIVRCKRCVPFALLAVAMASPCFAAGPVPVVMASGLLKKCLGIEPGADRMVRGPATQQYCQQLPANDIYNQAGARFQAGDHAGAAKIVTRAAEAGNAVAQLRLALLYDQGDGVPRSAKTALEWYSHAAAQGEPESQNQVGLFYELGEGVPENWDLAARLYQANAQQGWMKGQFSLGRAYHVWVSIASVRDRKATPRSFKSSSNAPQFAFHQREQLVQTLLVSGPPAEE